MEIRLVQEPITGKELAEIAKNQFGNLVKGVVDTEQEVMAIGGELHADEEAFLIERGSKQESLWGINLYPEKHDDDFIEFDSMINVRPSLGNMSRGVENKEIQSQIRAVVMKLLS